MTMTMMEESAMKAGDAAKIFGGMSRILSREPVDVDLHAEFEKTGRITPLLGKTSKRPDMVAESLVRSGAVATDDVRAVALVEARGERTLNGGKTDPDTFRGRVEVMSKDLLAAAPDRQTELRVHAVRRVLEKEGMGGAMKAARGLEDLAVDGQTAGRSGLARSAARLFADCAHVGDARSRGRDSVR